jgi:hypothetical protein
MGDSVSNYRIGRHYATCFDCGREHGHMVEDWVGGVWIDKCSICGEEKKCAATWHDWHMTDEEQEEAIRLTAEK